MSAVPVPGCVRVLATTAKGLLPMRARILPGPARRVPAAVPIGALPAGQGFSVAAPAAAAVAATVRRLRAHLGRTAPGRGERVE